MRFCLILWPSKNILTLLRTISPHFVILTQWDHNLLYFAFAFLCSNGFTRIHSENSVYDSSKVQKISKANYLVFISSKNEQNSCLIQLLGQNYFVCFLENTRKRQFAFEIFWPLYISWKRSCIKFECNLIKLLSHWT